VFPTSLSLFLSVWSLRVLLGTFPQILNFSETRQGGLKSENTCLEGTCFQKWSELCGVEMCFCVPRQFLLYIYSFMVVHKYARVYVYIYIYIYIYIYLGNHPSEVNR